MTIRLQGQVSSLDINGSIDNKTINGGVGDSNLIGRITGCVTTTTNTDGIVIEIDNNWVLNGDMYYKDINHNLNTLHPSITIREDNKNIIITHEVKSMSNNVLRLYVPSEPDCRFNGYISLVKV